MLCQRHGRQGQAFDQKLAEYAKSKQGDSLGSRLYRAAGRRVESPRASRG